MAGAHQIHRTVEAVWRIESARIIAGLARILRDVGLAEEFAQDALVAALEQWPEQGVPDRPAAWLTAIAKNRAIDWIRRRSLHERKQDALTRETESTLEDAAAHLAASTDAAFDDPIGDDLLRLIFIACHPVLSREARAALTLRMLDGRFRNEKRARSASFARSERWQKRTYRSKCRPQRNWRCEPPPYSR